jgi:hypothetical protein
MFGDVDAAPAAAGLEKAQVSEYVKYRATLIGISAPG